MCCFSCQLQNEAKDVILATLLLEKKMLFKFE